MLECRLRADLTKPDQGDKLRQSRDILSELNFLNPKNRSGRYVGFGNEIVYCLYDG